VDRIIEILNSCHGFLCRAIILSVNSRLPVPVGLFVLVTHPIHRTCMTSRCPMVLKHFRTSVLMNSRMIYVLYSRNWIQPLHVYCI